MDSESRQLLSLQLCIMASLAASLNMTPGSLRSKSLGARNYRASFAPVNGSSFKSLEQLKFQLPSVPRTYADLTTAVVRGKISSESGAATDVCFIERNIYSIINRLEVSVANQQLDNIPNFNVLVHAMSDLGAGVMNSGNILTRLFWRVATWRVKPSVHPSPGPMRPGRLAQGVSHSLCRAWAYSAWASCCRATSPRTSL